MGIVHVALLFNALFHFTQAVVSIYVFVAVTLMLGTALIRDPDLIFPDGLRRQALAWPIIFIGFIKRKLRTGVKKCKVKTANFLIEAHDWFFYNGIPQVIEGETKKALDFDIDDVVFFVRDEDRDNPIFTEPTRVNGTVINLIKENNVKENQEVTR